MTLLMLLLHMDMKTKMTIADCDGHAIVQDMTSRSVPGCLLGYLNDPVDVVGMTDGVIVIKLAFRGYRYIPEA